MTLNQVDPEPTSEHDNSTIWTATTPPETCCDDLQLDHQGPDSTEPGPLLVPSPGSTFIIRSVSCGNVITVLDGQITLTQPGSSRGSIHWVCVETKGWLGFRNTVSGRFLGHDAKGRLCCSAERHREWEKFCFRMRPEGGCFLLMTHWDRLWKVGVKMDEGVEKLGRIGDGGDGGIVWEFAKV